MPVEDSVYTFDHRDGAPAGAIMRSIAMSANGLWAVIGEDTRVVVRWRITAGYVPGRPGSDFAWLVGGVDSRGFVVTPTDFGLTDLRHYGGHVAVSATGRYVYIIAETAPGGIPQSHL